MNLTKVTVKKAEVFLVWSTVTGANNATTIEHELQSNERGRPELYAAMESFLTPCFKLLQLPATYAKAAYPTSVSISHTEKNGRGIVVTLVKPIEGLSSPFLIHTPYLTEEGPKGATTIPTAMIESLDQLLIEAVAYINGKREQLDAFDQQPTPKPGGGRSATAQAVADSSGSARPRLTHTKKKGKP